MIQHDGVLTLYNKNPKWVPKMFRNTESKIRMKTFPKLSESAPGQDACSPNLGKVFLGDYENEII